MKKSKCIGLEDCEKPLGTVDKLKILGIVSVPFVIYGLIMLSTPKPKPPRVLEPYFPEAYQKPQVEKIEPIFQKGEALIKDAKTGGVVLNINGGEIHTGLSSEQILEQLDFDYYDIFDYYGGAEEVY